MRSRRGQSELFSNPALIGAVTTLVAVVGVLLAYNANSGLPFVPTYDVTAEVPNAAELVPGNEVRIGGSRVGVITGIGARLTPAGRPTARLKLKLDRTVAPLPRDTVATVRPRSPLGLKYLELRPGRSGRRIPAGGTLALSQARASVDLDQVVNALDAPTRAGLRGVVTELGDGLAGRGADLNRSLEDLPPLVSALEPVGRNLRSPRTDLAGFVAGVASGTAAVAPVAPRLGGLLDGASATLAAIASTRGALGEALTEAPPTEAVAARVARRVRPVLGDTAALLHDARPGAGLLGPTSGRLADALEAGTPVLRRATVLADRLAGTLAAVEELVRDPATGGSIRKLTRVVTSLAPTLAFVNPMQVRCNYLGLWTRSASSSISEGDANGTWFRFIAIAQPDENLQSRAPGPGLHANTYPHAGQGAGECESGNEPYLPGRRIGNVPGEQGGSTEQTAPPPGVGSP